MTGAEFKARIKAAKGRVRLGDLIGFDVALHRRGGELVGLCPFHAERTPSFTVTRASRWVADSPTRSFNHDTGW